MQGTQPSFLSEGLQDIFQRHRPSLPKGILSFVSLEDLKEEVICVTGESGSGKTMLLMELMGRTLLLPNEESPEVLFVNIEKDFNILKFMETSTKHVKPDQNNLDHEQNVIKQSLERLHILNCSEHAFDVVNRIEQAVAANKNISIVLIDSLGLDYYREAFRKDHDESINIRKETYLSSCIKNLRKISRKYAVSIAYTKPNFLRGNLNSKDNISSHRIDLERLSEVVYVMLIKSKGNSRKVWYTIDFYGLKIVEE